MGFVVQHYLERVLAHVGALLVGVVCGGGGGGPVVDIQADPSHLRVQRRGRREFSGFRLDSTCRL